VFRPATYKSENEYELVLMKNRREELIDIPLEYVESIEFNMGTHLQEPTKLTLTIPSHINRVGELMEYPLYNMIKGKMQLKLTVNGKIYRLSLEEESTVETSKIHKKTFTAQEIFYKFNTTDFAIATDIATRQLYKASNETLETSDGVLNWFEQQCTGWTVGTITEKAKKEISMCSEVRRVDLSRVDKTITNEIFNQNVSISALANKPLNMKMVMDATVYDKNNRVYVTQTLQFDFTNLPYAIKNIRANYSSTSKHFYGITFTITYTNDHVSTHEYAFVNCKNVRLVANTAIEYELGNLVERNITKYRTFETTVTTWMNMLQQIAESFDVIILFDSGNYKINVCHREEFGELTNVSLSYDNALKEISKQRKLDEIVTRLTVESQNTTIASVNVLGTDYVECYDYFIENGIMSNELQTALERYNTLLQQKDVEFNNLLVQKHDADQALSLANSQLLSLQSKYSTEKAILSAYIKAKEPVKQASQQKIVTNYENQVAQKLNEVQTRKDAVANLDVQLSAIGEAIRKENTGYFTQDLLLELSDYLIEKAITDDTHLTAHGVYEYVTKQIKEYQKPIIDFSVTSSMEFIKRTGRKVTDCVFIGAKMGIEDKSGEISEDGTVNLYGFTIVPSTDELTNIRFTNGSKAPDSPLKQVTKVAQDVKATKSMTDFYKSTLQQIKNYNPDVAKIIEEGLDLAAQKVRSRTDTNIIEIDEAGIFLIDANNENEQLALINDLIAMTTDRWETARVAISPEGIMAEELIGKIIIGEQLYLGNETNSFKIDVDIDPSTGKKSYGMFVYSKDTTNPDISHLRVFLGIDKNDRPQLLFFDRGVMNMADFHNPSSQAYKDALRVFLGVDNNNVTKFELYSGELSDGTNELIMSSAGMFSCYQVNDRDSFDYTHSFKSYFYVPDTLDKTFESRIIVYLDNFRAYSKAADSKVVNLTSTESEVINLNSTESEVIDLTSTHSEKINLTTTGSEKINLTTTETQSFSAVSTGGSGTIGVNLDVKLNGLSGGATGATVGGTSDTLNASYTTDYPEGMGSGGEFFEAHRHFYNPKHSHSVSCGSHSHTISVSGNVSGSASAADHTHSFTVPTHAHSITMPTHSHSITMPSHTHGITMPAHVHGITMPAHTHDITMPSHDHELIYGIFENEAIPSCRVYLDSSAILDMTKGEGTYQADITNKFKTLTPGFHFIEIKISDYQYSGLARASFTLFWSGYFRYKS
jgi:hypothetical protein